MDSKIIVASLVAGFALVISHSLRKATSYASHKHPILSAVRRNFARLNPRYYNIPLQLGNEAYTENKAMIKLCIVNPKNGRYYDMNTIMYVALHELAHLVSKEHDPDHGPEFKANFKILLNQATSKGIFNPNIPVADNYCKL